LVEKNGDLSWVGTSAANELIGAYVKLGQPNLNTRIERRARLANPGFCTDSDMFTSEEMDHDPFYRDFMRPRGYGWVSGTCVRPPSGETLIVAIERNYTRGPFEMDMIHRLDVFGPHLSRAALLSARLGLERARAMADALAVIGLPAAVLRGRGRLYAANLLLERMIPDIFQDSHARLKLSNSAADALYATAVENLTAVDLNENITRSIPIPANNGTPAMIVHLLPVRRAAQDVFSRGSGLLVVTPVDRGVVPNAEVLSGLFDLTPAEARIARGIASGETINTIAQTRMISRETVRNQLKGILAKTGLSRQSDLAALLNGIAVPRSLQS
jgi:DNA-binding CsgD family transcriptional regulator